MYLDQLNLFLPMDNELAEELKNLSPHKSSFSLNAPKELSNAMTIPKPVISTMANWIDSTDEVADPQKLAIMAELLT